MTKEEIEIDLIKYLNCSRYNSEYINQYIEAVAEYIFANYTKKNQE